MRRTADEQMDQQRHRQRRKFDEHEQSDQLFQSSAESDGDRNGDGELREENELRQLIERTDQNTRIANKRLCLLLEHAH